MLTNKYFMINVPLPCFGTPEEDAVASAAAEAAKATEVGKKKVEMTQDELNGLLAKEKRKTVEQLEQLKNAAGTSERRAKELEDQIQGLKSSYQTKAEQEQEKFERTLTEYKTNFETTSKDRDGWKSRFTDTVIDRDILAASGDAYNAEIIVRILKPDTKLVEVLDENGKPTGKLEPRVTMQKMNKENKLVDLELTPAEAVEEMKKNTAKYASLFKSTMKSGMGGGNTSDKTDTGISDAELARTNPEAYRAKYKQERFPTRKA